MRLLYLICIIPLLLACEGARFDLIYDSAKPDCLLKKVKADEPYKSRLRRIEIPSRYHILEIRQGITKDKIIGNFERHPLFEEKGFKGLPYIYVFSAEGCEVYLERKARGPYWHVVDEARIKELYNKKVAQLGNEDTNEPHKIPGKIEVENYSDMSGIGPIQVRDTDAGMESRPVVMMLRNSDWAEYMIKYDDVSSSYNTLELKLNIRSLEHGALNILLDGKEVEQIDISAKTNKKPWMDVSANIPVTSITDSIHTIRVEFKSTKKYSICRIKHLAFEGSTI
ncbi:carbohydrate-binding protein [Carboxylicivirga marina]|uniref:CBM6 domain-containing protein n=1 Tax=Carboxylicivirga marina TaxID=2800988 RepID=A0ABS1HF25_9BACT|nr:hypothetical protein [Carboxylicivirga marina]MBK3515893.1 hypothetical protein [Carboxylicivirga marina]